MKIELRQELSMDTVKVTEIDVKDLRVIWDNGDSIPLSHMLLFIKTWIKKYDFKVIEK